MCYENDMLVYTVMCIYIYIYIYVIIYIYDMMFICMPAGYPKGTMMMSEY